jgi:hypothetical protein
VNKPRPVFRRPPGGIIYGVDPVEKVELAKTRRKLLCRPKRRTKLFRDNGLVLGTAWPNE